MSSHGRVRRKPGPSGRVTGKGQPVAPSARIRGWWISAWIYESNGFGASSGEESWHLRHESADGGFLPGSMKTMVSELPATKNHGTFGTNPRVVDFCLDLRKQWFRSFQLRLATSYEWVFPKSARMTSNLQRLYGCLHIQTHGWLVIASAQRTRVYASTAARAAVGGDLSVSKLRQAYAPRILTNSMLRADFDG